VDLSNNVLDDDGLKYLSDFLKESTTIDTLILNNCRLGVKSPAFLQAAQMFNPKLKLRRLSMDNNDINNLGLKHLGLFLAKMGSIVELSVRNNVKAKTMVNDRGISYLCEGLV